MTAAFCTASASTGIVSKATCTPRSSRSPKADLTSHTAATSSDVKVRPFEEVVDPSTAPPCCGCVAPSSAPSRRRGRLVGHLPVRPARLPETARRRQRRGVAGHHRAPPRARRRPRAHPSARAHRHPARPSVAARRPGRPRPRPVGGAATTARPSNARPWPTTTSPACRSPRSPNYSTTPPTPHGALPPTASSPCARSTRRTKHHDCQHLR